MHGPLERIIKNKNDSISDEPRTTQAYCRRKADWVVKKVYEPHTHHFRTSLVNLAISRRLDPNVPYQVLTSSLGRPCLPANIAKKPKPPKEEAVLAHRSRFK